MAGEVFEGDFFYDRIFLETSWFVHSGFRSCLDIVAELRSDECYSLGVRYNKKTAAYGLFLRAGARISSHFRYMGSMGSMV